MKKLTALILALAVFLSLSGIGEAAANDGDLPAVYDPANEKQFTYLDDPELLRHIEDEVYAQLSSELVGMQYEIDSISAIYISKEYLEEINYNTKANVFFGYTLAELNESFQGARYVFTLEGDKTVAQEFREYDDSLYRKMITDIIIGVGVILVCVVITVATYGASSAGTGTAIASTTTKMAYIFSCSAKGAAIGAVAGGASGVIGGAVVAGAQNDWDLDAMMLGAAEKVREQFNGAR